jgi:hypothetical protein
MLYTAEATQSSPIIIYVNTVVLNSDAVRSWSNTEQSKSQNSHFHTAFTLMYRIPVE